MDPDLSVVMKLNIFTEIREIYVFSRNRLVWSLRQDFRQCDTLLVCLFIGLGDNSRNL